MNPNEQLAEIERAKELVLFAGCRAGNVLGLLLATGDIPPQHARLVREIVAEYDGASAAWVTSVRERV